MGKHCSRSEELLRFPFGAALRSWFVGATLRRQFVSGGTFFFTCKNLFLLINFYVQIWKLKRVFFVKEMDIESMLFLFVFIFRFFAFISKSKNGT